jgi:hypothetical protein
MDDDEEGLHARVDNKHRQEESEQEDIKTGDKKKRKHDKTEVKEREVKKRKAVVPSQFNERDLLPSQRQPLLEPSQVGGDAMATRTQKLEEINQHFNGRPNIYFSAFPTEERKKLKEFGEQNLAMNTTFCLWLRDLQWPDILKMVDYTWYFFALNGPGCIPIDDIFVLFRTLFPSKELESPASLMHLGKVYELLITSVAEALYGHDGASALTPESIVHRRLRQCRERAHYITAMGVAAASASMVQADNSMSSLMHLQDVLGADDEIKRSALSDFERARLNILRFLNQNKYRRLRSNIFKPKINKEGIFVNAYVKLMSIDQFVARSTGHYAVGGPGGRIMNKTGNMTKQVIEGLRANDDAAFPVLNLSRRYFGFGNGVFDSITESLTEHDHMVSGDVVCRSWDERFDVDEFTPLRRSSFFPGNRDPRCEDLKETEDIPYLRPGYKHGMPNRVSNPLRDKVLEVKVDPNAPDWLDSAREHCPAWFTICDTQWKDATSHDNQKDNHFMYCDIMIRFIFAFIGRLLHPLRLFDRWELHFCGMGESGTGKSILCSSIQKLFQTENIEVLADQMEEGFGLGQFGAEDSQIFLWIMNEVSAACKLHVSDFLHMVTGETISVRKKFKDATAVEFLTPGAFFGNHMPEWKHMITALARRFFMVMFNVVVPDRDESIEGRVHAELPHLLFYFNHAYLSLIRYMDSRRIRIPQDCWHSILTIRQREYAQGTDPVDDFLASPDVTFPGEGEDPLTFFVSQKTFLVKLREFCKAQSRTPTKWDATVYTAAFRKHGLLFDPTKKEKKGKENGVFIYGVKIEQQDEKLQAYQPGESSSSSSLADPPARRPRRILQESKHSLNTKQRALERFREIQDDIFSRGRFFPGYDHEDKRVVAAIDRQSYANDLMKRDLVWMGEILNLQQTSKFVMVNYTQFRRFCALIRSQFDFCEDAKTHKSRLEALTDKFKRSFFGEDPVETQAVPFNPTDPYDFDRPGATAAVMFRDIMEDARVNGRRFPYGSATLANFRKTWTKLNDEAETKDIAVKRAKQLCLAEAESIHTLLDEQRKLKSYPMTWKMFEPFKQMFFWFKREFFDIESDLLTEEEVLALDEHSTWIQTVQKTSTYFG